MENLDAFWNAGNKELKQGYSEEKDHYSCLLCSEKIEKGIVYQDSGVLYEAEKFMKIHIERNHNSVFDYLIKLDKKLTGLTEHQNHLLSLFYQGKSDADIQKETGIGSASTIRNHRFVLKEKERQAKLFLVLMELLKEKDQHAPNFLPLHKTAKMVDDRYNITEDEKEKSLKKYFPEGVDGPLTKFPLKEKQKLVVLREIAKRFSPNKSYTEKEINAVLTAIYHDYVILRRYLIEYGFIDRKADGSSYWLKV
ncbi:MULTISPECIES: DUF2087 domain-containing protein [unclassified Bacillus (in: firmicutes)]|uniref:DUF2087 domain-containing protein n=1 Tax=unclassified Bacillus (in: firmicutes) TaxID=185979 RepID=UPI000BEF453B|nr:MULTISPECIES: DUF2087 domain-containing protein [unclassified Bacillus (in: firmicutes)]PEJ59554.1 transcriptional regulator [Bacillus sp. AFS002410]PEL13619.1 transcriptional regulator [Bacillus sp. AFS017336]